jgi:hypothetical protein
LGNGSDHARTGGLTGDARAMTAVAQGRRRKGRTSSLALLAVFLGGCASGGAASGGSANVSQSWHAVDSCLEQHPTFVGNVVGDNTSGPDKRGSLTVETYSGGAGAIAFRFRSNSAAAAAERGIGPPGPTVTYYGDIALEVSSGTSQKKAVLIENCFDQVYGAPTSNEASGTTTTATAAPTSASMSTTGSAVTSTSPQGQGMHAAIVAAKGDPARCLHLTISSADPTYVRVGFVSTSSCAQYEGNGVWVFHESGGTWSQAFDASSYKCPVASLPAAVQTDLGVCRATSTPASPPSGGLNAVQCDSNVSAGSSTSCPFAEDVFKAYAEHFKATGAQSATLHVASPTTGQIYSMACKTLAAGELYSVVCSGGNEASVSFPLHAAQVY